MNQFIELISQALKDAENKSELQLTKLNIITTQAADLLVNSAHGIKQAAISIHDFRDRLQRLILMFERATSND